MPSSTTLPVAEGGRSSGGDGIPMPYIIAGGVGLLVLIFLMNKQSSGGAPGTTAAGASINAALGSIQEQNLNILGQVGLSEARLKDELGKVDQSVITGNNRQEALASMILGGQAASDAWATHQADRTSILFKTGWDISDPMQGAHWLAGDLHPGGNLNFADYSNAVDWATGYAPEFGAAAISKKWNIPIDPNAKSWEYWYAKLTNG